MHSRIRKKRKRAAGRKPTGRRVVAKARKPMRRVKAGATSRAKAAFDPLDVMIASAAATLALPIDPAWKPAIRANLQVTLGHAALVGEFALADDAEPAPVFKA